MTTKNDDEPPGPAPAPYETKSSTDADAERAALITSCWKGFDEWYDPPPVPKRMMN